jgi:aldose 1-epimerase
MQILKKHFGYFNDVEILKYILINDNGMSVCLINYGAIITNIKLKDKRGNDTDVVLGFDTLDKYLAEHPYFGATVGRYANRIANGKFDLNSQEFNLAKNNGYNNLHGGIIGFDKKIWDVETVEEDEKVSIKMSLLSLDMEEGFPGNMKVDAIFSLDNENNLQINYSATCDETTICNLTNHSYFNFDDSENVLHHELMIDGKSITPILDGGIPTGEFLAVENTAFDFMESKKIGRDINDTNEQLSRGNNGYDHNFVLSNSSLQHLSATAFSNESGIKMELYTDMPGAQLFTANHFDGSIIGKNQKKYKKNAGFCLETQYFPDTPNQKAFPQCTLNPHEKYFHNTIYKFSIVTN